MLMNGISHCICGLESSALPLGNWERPNEPTNQPNNQPSEHPTNQPNNQPFTNRKPPTGGLGPPSHGDWEPPEPTNQATSEPNNQSTNQPTIHQPPTTKGFGSPPPMPRLGRPEPTSQPTNQRSNHPTNHSSKHEKQPTIIGFGVGGSGGFGDTLPPKPCDGGWRVDVV